MLNSEKNTGKKENSENSGNPEVVQGEIR
jgi:hypothetical protein